MASLLQAPATKEESDANFRGAERRSGRIRCGRFGESRSDDRWRHFIALTVTNQRNHASISCNCCRTIGCPAFRRGRRLLASLLFILALALDLTLNCELNPGRALQNRLGGHFDLRAEVPTNPIQRERVGRRDPQHLAVPSNLRARPEPQFESFFSDLVGQRCRSADTMSLSSLVNSTHPNAHLSGNPHRRHARCQVEMTARGDCKSSRRSFGPNSEIRAIKSVPRLPERRPGCATANAVVSSYDARRRGRSPGDSRSCRMRRRATKHVTRSPDCSVASTAVKGFWRLLAGEKKFLRPVATYSAKNTLLTKCSPPFSCLRQSALFRGKPV